MEKNSKKVFYDQRVNQCKNFIRLFSIGYVEKAKAAAQALANYENRFARIDTDLALLKWMIGFNLACTMAILWKLFSG